MVSTGEEGEEVSLNPGWMNINLTRDSLKDIRGASKGPNDPKSPRLPSRLKRAESTSLPIKNPPSASNNGVKSADAAKAADNPIVNDEAKSSAVKIERMKSADQGQERDTAEKPGQVPVSS